MAFNEIAPGVSSRCRCYMALLVLGVCMPAGPAAANGWEHGAVPLDALVRALSFDSAVIRQRAAESLGFRRQEAGVRPLLDRLRAPEPDPWVRRAIYRALGRVGAAPGTPALVRCLGQEQLVPLRAACAEALGGIGNDDALEALLTLMDDDAEPAVLTGMIRALGDFDSPRAVNALAGFVESTDDPDTRKRAIRALGRTGNEAAAGPLLVALAESETDDQRLVVVQALSDVASPTATGPLTGLIEEADDPRLRAALAVALGASRDGDARDVLVDLLEDPVPAVRYLAIGALERLGQADTASALADLAQREAARLAALDSKAWVSNPLQTVAALSLQTRALQAAIELNPDAARSALTAAAAPVEIPHSSSEALEVASAVYRRRRVALYGLGYVEATPALVALLKGPAGMGDTDPRLRAVAVRSIGVMHPTDAAGIVRPALADPATEVRMTAARVLGRLGAGTAVPALEDALSDDRALVRKEAALALGYIGDPHAETALREAATRDGSEAVREAAAYAVSLLPIDS